MGTVVRTIVKNCRFWSSKDDKWLWIDVEVELDPYQIGRAYASRVAKNKSGRSKQLSGLVTITRRTAPREERS